MSEPAGHQDVLVTADHEVMIITINRPAAKNAITLAVAPGIATALDELDAQDDLAVGIITGSGGTFCAGMDLKGFVDGQLP
jgi:enoyl-CoA hydratase